MNASVRNLSLLGLLCAGALLSMGFVASVADDGLVTAAVTKGDLAIEVELAGTFVADDKDEIRVEPESYRGELIVTQLMKEGRAVKKGDVLIEFDKSSLEDSLEDAQDEVVAKQVAARKADADLKAWEIDNIRKKVRSDAELEKARRALEKAKADAELTLADKLKGVEDADRGVRDAEIDFEQLTQLYEERQLHTATENILIERQRRGVDRAKRSADKTKKQFEIWEKFEKGNEIVDKQLDFGDKKAEVEKAAIQSEADRTEKEAEVTKAEKAQKKAEKKVLELEEDASSLKVLSPRDGIVFYGTIGFESPSDVVFIGMGNVSDDMKIGGRVRTHQVLMTVASMERLSVKMRALESDIQHLKEGLPIVVRPNAFPSLAIDGELTKVDQVASRTGFMSDLREFSVRGTYDETYPQLRSGMNCRVTVRADSVPDCLRVPVLAVFTESSEHYCLVMEGGEPTRRKVKIGASNGTLVEIKEGLRVGERVALHDPTAS